MPPPEYEAPRKGPSELDWADSALPHGTVKDLAERVDSYMGRFGERWGEAYAPSGVLVVAWQGRPFLVREYGVADRATRAAFTIDTPVFLGELVRPLAASLVLKMVDERVLSLEDSVRRWVAELPADYEAVTLRHVITHTSGAPNIASEPRFARGPRARPTLDEWVGWLAEHELESEPGERVAISVSNDLILDKVIERATTRQVLDGISTIVLAGADARMTGAPSQAAAKGYVRLDDDRLAPSAKANSVVGLPDVWASASDWLAWESVLLNPGFISDTTRAELGTGLATCSSCGGGATAKIACGGVAEDVAGEPVLWLAASGDGFSRYVGRAASSGISVVMFANVAEFDAQAAGRAVLAMAVTGKAEVAPEEPELEPVDEAFGNKLAGSYELDAASQRALEEMMPAILLTAIASIEIGFAKGTLTLKVGASQPVILRRLRDNGVLVNGRRGYEVMIGDDDTIILKQGRVEARYRMRERR